MTLFGQGMTSCSGDCCFGVIYDEWYGACDFVVLSVFVDYGGVNVFHLCLDLDVVNGVGVCVNVCGVVCIHVCYLFLTSEYCLLCSSVMGVCVGSRRSDVCLICNASSGRCSFMGSVFVSSYICYVCCAPSGYSECGVLCYL